MSREPTRLKIIGLVDPFLKSHNQNQANGHLCDMSHLDRVTGIYIYITEDFFSKKVRSDFLP